MKKNKSLFLLILVLPVIIQAASFAQSENKDDQMQAYTNYMTPGPEHKMLANMNGNWTVNTTMWMDPKSEPTTSTGTAKFEMIMGGRYQLSNFKGTFMNMPFEGMNIMGYDNGKKMYFSSWYDNMGTGIMYAEGTFDDATKTFNLTGKFYEPSMNKDMDFREAIKIVDDNNVTLEMYVTKDGKEMKVMEDKYMKKM